jgi:ComF family protein
LTDFGDPAEQPLNLELSQPAVAQLSDRVDRLLDWLFPPRCRACGVWTRGPDSACFCSSCAAAIELIEHPLCIICGRPFPGSAGEDHLCGACIRRAPHFQRARSWACYPREEADPQPLRTAVQKFKYGRKVSLGKPLGRLMAAGCGEFLVQCRPELIVPVPLHPKRLRWRGFNQSLLLARQVSRACGAPVDAFLLIRRRETPPQTQLSEEERRKNMRGAFAVRAPASVRGKTLLLIDDVYTSGATVNECSRELRRAGARAVNVLTLARAV